MPGLSEPSPLAPSPATLGELARATGSRLSGLADPATEILRPAPLQRAGLDAVAMFDGSVDLDQLVATRAGACFLDPEHADQVPSRTVAIVTDQPRRSFQTAVSLLTGSFDPLQAGTARRGENAGAFVHDDALLERDVHVEPGAVIGPGVEIGAGSFIGAQAVIAAGVCLGRGCVVHAGATVSHALIGDRVIVHSGARIGSPHVTVGGAGDREPQLGRVIVQDDAEIGANSVVQRGTSGDTVIGEGSAVEPLALVPSDQIVGRHTIVRGR